MPVSAVNTREETPGSCREAPPNPGGCAGGCAGRSREHKGTRRYVSLGWRPLCGGSQGSFGGIARMSGMTPGRCPACGIGNEATQCTGMVRHVDGKPSNAGVREAADRRSVRKRVCRQLPLLPLRFGNIVGTWAQCVRRRPCLAAAAVVEFALGGDGQGGGRYDGRTADARLRPSARTRGGVPWHRTLGAVPNLVLGDRCLLHRRKCPRPDDRPGAAARIGRGLVDPVNPPEAHGCSRTLGVCRRLRCGPRRSGEDHTPTSSENLWRDMDPRVSATSLRAGRRSSRRCAARLAGTMHSAARGMCVGGRARHRNGAEGCQPARPRVLRAVLPCAV